MDRAAWRAAVHGVSEGLGVTQRLSAAQQSRQGPTFLSKQRCQCGHTRGAPFPQILSITYRPTSNALPMTRPGVEEGGVEAGRGRGGAK